MLDFPRHFGFADEPDYDVPRLRGRRNEWGFSGFDEDAESEFYATWLAGYLAGIADRPVPSCQADLCARLAEMEPEAGASWLGRGAFEHLRDYEELAGYLQAGIPCADAEKKRKSLWSAKVLIQGLDRIGPFIEAAPACWAKARREGQELAALPDGVPAIDAGYRIPLARSLARVRRTEDKLKLLACFNNAFAEAESDVKGDRLF